MWPRGLKSYGQIVITCEGKSRLMWPRGLKCILYSSSVICSPSRLMWPRGLKFSPYHKYGKTRFVEAYVASWIEMIIKMD